MTKQSELTESHTDLGIAEELKNKEFRDQFFRTERELDIPAQLKTIRKFRDLNQGELADRVGTKQSSISRLERSSHGKWNLEFLVKVAEALDARLSVVIEPYETVIARYRARDLERGRASAATDQSKPREPAKIPDNPNEAQDLAKIPNDPNDPKQSFRQPGESEKQWT